MKLNIVHKEFNIRLHNFAMLVVKFINKNEWINFVHNLYIAIDYNNLN